MHKGQQKGKPTKDKRHFNSTAVNDTESALRRETHKGKRKKKRTQRTKAALYQKYICEHYWAGYPFSNSSFVYNLSPIYIIQKRVYGRVHVHRIFFCYQGKYYQGLRYTGAFTGLS